MGRLVSKASFILGSAHRRMDEGRHGGRKEERGWRENERRKGWKEGKRKDRRGMDGEERGMHWRKGGKTKVRKGRMKGERAKLMVVHMERRIHWRDGGIHETMKGMDG